MKHLNIPMNKNGHQFFISIEKQQAIYTPDFQKMITQNMKVK